jgi:hypothetical protein
MDGFRSATLDENILEPILASFANLSDSRDMNVIEGRRNGLGHHGIEPGMVVA